MKNVKYLVKQVQSLPQRVHIIAGVVVLASAVSVTAVAMRSTDQPTTNNHGEHAHHDHTPDQEVASTVNTTPEVQPQTHSPATPVAQTTQTPVTAKPATATRPTTQPAPAAPSKPAPVPGFELTIAAEAAMPNGPTQISVPFGITRGAGHTASFTFSTAITPASGQGVTCTVLMDAPTKGYLIVSAPDTAPTGTYICRLTVNDGAQTRTGQFDFMVTEDSVEP